MLLNFLLFVNILNKVSRLYNYIYINNTILLHIDINTEHNKCKTAQHCPELGPCTDGLCTYSVNNTTQKHALRATYEIITVFYEQYMLVVVAEDTVSSYTTFITTPIKYVCILCI